MFGKKVMAAKSRGIFCGYHYNVKANRAENAQFYADDRHGLIVGPTGSGKTARFLLNNLLADNLDGESLILIDPKSELAAVSALSRMKRGDDTYVIDPFGVLRELIRQRPEQQFKELIASGKADSVGFDPLLTLDFHSPNFYDECAALAEALIQIQGGAESHWSESAQGLITALIMWEVVHHEFEQVENKTDISLPNVRSMLTAAETLGPSGKDPDKEVPKTGLRRTALDILTHYAGAREREQRKEPNLVPAAVLEIIASLISRFTENNREVMSIRSTADTQTRWLLSPPIAADLNKKTALDFRKLKEKRGCCFIVLPSDKLRTHGAWLRLIIVTAIRRLSITTGLRTRIFIDEMPALGRLPPLADAFAQIRGFNVSLIGIVQDLNQLKALYADWWESFAANAGFIICFGPNDMTTAEWMSRRTGQWDVLMPTTNESGPVMPSDWSQRTAGKSSAYQLRPIQLPQDLFGYQPGFALFFRAGEEKAEKVELPVYIENHDLKERPLNPFHC